jgi:hypothetical protein
MSNSTRQKRIHWCQLLPEWPRCSIDLNIIETVWAIMKRRVDRYPPGTTEDLKISLQEVWDQMQFPTINGPIGFMQNRLIQVIAGNGAMIQHL